MIREGSFEELSERIEVAILQSWGLYNEPPWRNRLARSAVNRKVGGSSPPGGALFLSGFTGCPKMLTLAGLEPAIP